MWQREGLNGKAEKEQCCTKFREEMTGSGWERKVADWESTAEVVEETAKKVSGMSSGQKKEDKEIWWWNEEVQGGIYGIVWEMKKLDSSAGRLGVQPREW